MPENIHLAPSDYKAGRQTMLRQRQPGMLLNVTHTFAPVLVRINEDDEGSGEKDGWERREARFTALSGSVLNGC